MMIAVDAMGGDFAPAAIVEGVIHAARLNIPVTLFGNQDQLYPLLESYDQQWKKLPIVVKHTPDVIAMDDEAVSSVQKKPYSSLVEAVRSVQQKSCQAVISAGNSGALMAAAALLLGKQEGVLRPSIAGFLPTSKKPVLALDLGANTECRLEHLHQFARLATSYLQEHFHIAKPRVSLLANGHEDKKGSALTKQVFSLLSQDSSVHFIGNIEPYGIFKGETDIVVTDGFTGNILLKTMESVYAFFHSLTKHALSQEHTIIQQWGETFLFHLANRVDVREHGGAILLGVKGNVMVCHGNADAYAIKQAVIRSYHSLAATLPQSHTEVSTHKTLDGQDNSPY